MRILHKERKLGWIEFALKIIIELLIPKRTGVHSSLLKDVQYK